MHREQATRLYALGLIALIVLGALPILWYPLGRDQSIYATVGVSILQGGLPYLDAWDIKPPAIFYLYSAVIGAFGQTSASPRLLDLILMPVGMWGMFALGQRWGKLGLWTLGIFGVLYFSDAFVNLSQNDALALVPLIGVAWASLWAGDAPLASRQALLRAGMAGFLAGILVWFKHFYVLLIMALVLAHVMRRGWRAWRDILLEALAFSVGGFVIGVPILFALIANGMWEQMLILAQGTVRYNSSDFASFGLNLLNYAQWRWWYWGAGVVLALIALGFGRSVPVPALSGVSSEAQQATQRVIGAWVLGGLAFLLIQRQGFDTHWMPLLPPLALVAARGAYQLSHVPRFSGAWQKAMAWGLSVGLAGILLANTWLPSTAYALGQETQAAYYQRFQANDFKPWESLAIVDYLRPRLAQGDSLYIYGFRPEITYLGAWRHPTRFFSNYGLIDRAYPAEWRQENVNLLWAAMPPYVLVLENDFLPWVNGENADSHSLLQQDTELNNWLMANYERIHKLGDFIIWQRRPTS